MAVNNLISYGYANNAFFKLLNFIYLWVDYNIIFYIALSKTHTQTFFLVTFLYNFEFHWNN